MWALMGPEFIAASTPCLEVRPHLVHLCLRHKLHRSSIITEESANEQSVSDPRRQQERAGRRSEAAETRYNLTVTHLALHHRGGGHAVIEVACGVATGPSRTHGNVGSRRLRKKNNREFEFKNVHMNSDDTIAATSAKCFKLGSPKQMKNSLQAAGTACFDWNLLLWPSKQGFCAGSADT